jgi:hypothetical protein
MRISMPCGTLLKQADVFSFGFISEYHTEGPVLNGTVVIADEDFQT